MDDDVYLAVTLTPLGAVSRLEHAISDFEDALERCRQHLADARRRLSAYQSREGGDFAFAGELADKRRQLCAIEADLANDSENPGNRIAA